MKFHLFRRVLRLRAAHPEAFTGSYEPLELGPDRVGFVRGGRIRVVVPLRPDDAVESETRSPARVSPGNFAAALNPHTVAMSSDAWPSSDAPPAPLPRIEDLPVADQGYDQDAVRLAFDSFYRHAAQLDASLRALEAVEVFRRDADALRNDLRALRALGARRRAPRAGLGDADVRARAPRPDSGRGAAAGSRVRADRRRRGDRRRRALPRPA